jgi:hypothetical protein
MTNSNLTYFAVPYYGNIARTGHGFENIYIFASADRSTGKVTDTKVEAWCGHSAAELTNWLKEKEIDGLFAGDFSLALEKELSKTNIKSYWKTSIDVNEIAKNHWGKPQVA